PLGVFACVTGVSGAGKSSLVNGILLPALGAHLHDSQEPVGPHQTIKGIDELDKVIAIDQKPIGRTPRSNPGTYTKAFDCIREVFDTSGEECRVLFSAFPQLRRILETLEAVGLGYMKIGQPAPTLSGGEAQRVKLSREFGKTQTGRTLYVLDEPTTGLHFEDI